jgi:flagellar hook-associated protein 3 FlgL
MQAGDTQGLRDILGGIDEDLKKVVGFRAELGAKTNQLEMLADQISFHAAQLTELKSILGDTDLAKASIELGREELVYKSLLAATTRLLEVGLLHFLR